MTNKQIDIKQTLNISLSFKESAEYLFKYIINSEDLNNNYFITDLNNDPYILPKYYLIHIAIETKLKTLISEEEINKYQSKHSTKSLFEALEEDKKNNILNSIISRFKKEPEKNNIKNIIDLLKYFENFNKKFNNIINGQFGNKKVEIDRILIESIIFSNLNYSNRIFNKDYLFYYYCFIILDSIKNNYSKESLNLLNSEYKELPIQEIVNIINSLYYKSLEDLLKIVYSKENIKISIGEQKHNIKNIYNNLNEEFKDSFEDYLKSIFLNKHIPHMQDIDIIKEEHYLILKEINNKQSNFNKDTLNNKLKYLEDIINFINKKDEVYIKSFLNLIFIEGEPYVNYRYFSEKNDFNKNFYNPLDIKFNFYKYFLEFIIQRYEIII